jgi:hypothetical protein
MAAINPNTLFRTNALGLRPAANKAAGIASQNAMLTNQSKIAKMQQDSAKHTSDEAQATALLEKSNMDNEFSRYTGVAIGLGRARDDRDFHQRADQMYAKGLLTPSEYKDTQNETWTPELGAKLLNQGRTLSEIETAKQNKLDNAEKRKTRVQDLNKNIIDENLELDKQEEVRRHNLKQESTALLNARKKTGPLVVNQAGETEEQKGLGKELSNLMKEAREGAQISRTQNLAVQTLLENRTETGLLAKPKQMMARLGEAFNMTEDQLAGYGLTPSADSQVFEAAMFKLVLDEQSKQKGPQTLIDSQNIMKALPGLSKSGDANKLLARAMQNNNFRAIERYDFFRKYAKNNGGSLRGGEDAWFDSTGGLRMNVNEDEGEGVVFYFEEKKKYASQYSVKQRRDNKDQITAAFNEQWSLRE